MAAYHRVYDSNETFLTVMHYNIYLALKYPEKSCFLCEWHCIDENVSISWCHCVCNSWLHQYSKSLGVWVASYLQQRNEVYKISALYTEMFSFLFLVSSLECTIKTLNVTMATHSVFSGHS